MDTLCKGVTQTMKRVIVVSLALIMVVSSIALADGFGAFSGFKSGIGARALAMGGAFVAVADDATAVYWNPAGLAQVNDTRIAAMSTDLYGLGITHQFIGAVSTLANIGIGLGYERMAVSLQEVGGGGEPGDMFDWNESAILGTLAANIMDIGLAGVTAKYYMASALGDSADGFGFDLGLLVNLGDMFTIGVTAMDLAGSKISWSDHADMITGLYKAGVAMKLVDDTLILAADIDFDGTDLGDAHMGVEFSLIPELALRGGVVLTNEYQDYYFGVGAGINIAGLAVDAAYILDENIGNTLVLSAEFSLGGLLGGGEEEAEEIGIE